MEASGNHSIGAGGQIHPHALTFTGDSPATIENNHGTNQVASVGHMQLNRAILNRSENELRGLLSQGAPVNVRDRSGYEPLHHAVAYQDEKVIQLLLDFGANVDAKVGMDRTALHLAVRKKISLRVLLRADCNLNAQDAQGNTPLLWLLSQPLPDDSLDENIRLLITAGADVNVTNNSGNSAFHLLLNQVNNDNTHVYKMVQHFLEAGADTFLPNRVGRLPFDVFLQRSRFLHRGDRTSTSDDKSHPWKQWIESAEGCFLAFLESGVDFNVRDTSDELVAHLYLQRRYHMSSPITKQVTSLLSQKVDLNKIGKNGNHYIHELVTFVAAHRYYPGGENDLRTVLNRGADPNLQNIQGSSPIMVLLTFQQEYGLSIWGHSMNDLLEILLKSGAKPWIRDNSGNLPIYEAARNFPSSAREITQMLLLIKREEDTSQDRETLEWYDNTKHKKDSSWWDAWDRAVADDDWDRHKACLDVARKSLPVDIQETFYKIMIGILAEIYLEKAKERFSAKEISLNERRSFISSITKDARMLRFHLDRTWLEWAVTILEE
ncbi:uncharacterized protein A1O9_11188 [Exophiala aquamarina CBS 119918]|uniref:Uncharacterized protein n=1 Tax=Exophiala aquamarina CBS 119918 TaxID=1182545 RepID=A0A072NYZ4_9EURO|nr:uncharacterized protein A1O9_11188 [Exophiala aquamarina CBS 119918]KEF52771.1 hypothetical protein A1O9_11188 [Exophiala aquamarina CBS 119918]